jgi:1-acyl-sn-glycerol-3-phosphate acyltransferase
MVITLRSIIYFIYMVAVVFFFGVMLFPFGGWTRYTALKVVVQPWARAMIWGARAICGIDYEVRGLENIPQGAVIFAPKHQSAWETVAFLYMMDPPAFVLKKELLLLPVVGWYIQKIGSIIIDRASGPKAIKKMLTEAKERVASGYKIIIFPEGTRIPVGEGGTYHPGVAALYSHLDIPLVPVALNSGVCWGRYAFRKKPGKVIVEYLEPIAAGALRRDQVLDALAQRVETATRRLEAEALGMKEVAA